MLEIRMLTPDDLPAFSEFVHATIQRPFPQWNLHRLERYKYQITNHSPHVCLAGVFSGSQLIATATGRDSNFYWWNGQPRYMFPYWFLSGYQSLDGELEQEVRNRLMRTVFEYWEQRRYYIFYTAVLIRTPKVINSAFIEKFTRRAYVNQDQKYAMHCEATYSADTETVLPDFYNHFTTFRVIPGYTYLILRGEQNHSLRIV